jgi:hypothetical protein
MKTTNELQFKMKVLITLLLMALVPAFSLAQENALLDQPEKQEVIDSIALLMTEKYVFPDVGQEMGDLILKNLEKGNYDNIQSHQEFAEILTMDLRSVSNDKHIGIRYSPERIAMQKKAEADAEDKELEIYTKRLQEASNYNFKEIRILPGNVGYLKFNSFMDASVAGPTAVAALNFLAHTDALIIDLRDNGGGSPSLIQLMTTYFFDDTEHLNSFYIREGDKTDQFWTLPWVPGPRMVNNELYVLTSNRTFSGAEEFTYNLKNMKRATIVGETTGGGAHPVSGYILNDNFIISVPFGRAVNPITQTNWEGTGVEPDVKVAREEAYDVAYEMALESLLEKETMDEIKNAIAWKLDALKAEREPYHLDEKDMKAYIGEFGPRKITLSDGVLYYQREERPKMQMIPMTEDTFWFKELDYFRLKFIRENGKIIAVEGMYDNGRTDRNDKS